MAQNDVEKIKAIIDGYRQFKIKFIQFSKLFELMLSEEEFLDVQIVRMEDARLELMVLDTPVVVKFSLIYDTANNPLGKIDFYCFYEFRDPSPECLYSLFFNNLGHILDGPSDSFSHLRISDEHDIPEVLHRFLQRHLHALRIKEPAKEKKSS